MQIERNYSDGLEVNKLPDGSTVIVDRGRETVFALNAAAGAAWEACNHPTTLSVVTEEMQRSLGTTVTKEMAEAAILQLQERNLIKASGTLPNRRQFISALSALPFVVALPLAEQRAHAQNARSVPTQGGTNPTSGGNNGGGDQSWLDWLLHLLGLE